MQFPSLLKKLEKFSHIGKEQICRRMHIERQYLFYENVNFKKEKLIFLYFSVKLLCFCFQYNLRWRSFMYIQLKISIPSNEQLQRGRRGVILQQPFETSGAFKVLVTSVERIVAVFRCRLITRFMFYT